MPLGFWDHAVRTLPIRRFVAQGLGQAAPWERLKAQIWLDRAKMLKRTKPLAQGKSLRNVPRPQQRPARVAPEATKALVQNTYRTKDEKDNASARDQTGHTGFSQERLLEFSAFSFLMLRSPESSKRASRCTGKPHSIALQRADPIGAT
jgi:hypothetical protein